MHMRSCSRAAVFVACLLAGTPFACAPDARGQLSDLIDGVTSLANDYEIDPSLIRKPTPEEWNVFWGAVNNALQSDSLDQLADLLPYAQTALAYLDRVPDAKPYADWLRQRMDYITFADELIKEEPRTTAPVPPPPPKKTGTIAPPPAKPEPAAPAVAKPAAASAAHKSMDVDRWVTRLEKRPAPTAADRYVPLLKPVFRNEGVPEQLVWLAEVESSFDPAARSPVGALGLYQFMPATAERFGLSLRPRDERAVPERSATAAAKYLKFLHGRFGSWPLALAAYNAGEGRVGKLLSLHEGTTFEDIAAYLPAETRMYVPKIDAVVRIREGVKLSAL